MIERPACANESYENNVDFFPNLEYDEENSSGGGDNMTASNLLRAALEARGLNQIEASKSVGWTKETLYGRLHRGTLRADDFFAIMEAIGVDVVLRVRETGELIGERIPGIGPRVKQMVDRVKYDTANSDCIATGFYADGVNMYNDEGKATELYLDGQGRYFFAEYTNWDGGKNRISPTTKEIAASFIKKYGTEIHSKIPKTE